MHDPTHCFGENHQNTCKSSAVRLILACGIVRTGLKTGTREATRNGSCVTILDDNDSRNVFASVADEAGEEKSVRMKELDRVRRLLFKNRCSLMVRATAYQLSPMNWFTSGLGIWLVANIGVTSG